MEITKKKSYGKLKCSNLVIRALKTLKQMLSYLLLFCNCLGEDRSAILTFTTLLGHELTL